MEYSRQYGTYTIWGQARHGVGSSRGMNLCIAASYWYVGNMSLAPAPEYRLLGGL